MVSMVADQLYEVPLHHCRFEMSTCGLHIDGPFEIADGLTKIVAVHQ